MSKFRGIEKSIQTQFKESSPYLTDAARSDGIYYGKPRSFCLPTEDAEQNLIPAIQEPAISFFADHKIKWHKGVKGKPSNHLCSSQVCCVNFLFPFSDKPDALAQVFRFVYPDIMKMLPIEDERYVSFEWIGQQNYLGEIVPKSGKRTRGANCTSADAIVMFERKDKKRQTVLIEWKYTESYESKFLKYSDSGTDRTKIYRPLFERDDCPINKDILPNFDSLFYEPFYQLMRQQFLANEMEVERENGADIVSVLHIAPACNREFHKVTSPDLRKIGDSAIGIWEKLVEPEGRFASVSIEKLFGNLSETQLPGIKSWIKYINSRYPWIREQ